MVIIKVIRSVGRDNFVKLSSPIEIIYLPINTAQQHSFQKNITM